MKPTHKEQEEYKRHISREARKFIRKIKKDKKNINIKDVPF